MASDLIAWRAPNAFQDSQSVQYALHWSASASLSITGTLQQDHSQRVLHGSSASSSALLSHCMAVQRLMAGAALMAGLLPGPFLPSSSKPSICLHKFLRACEASCGCFGESCPLLNQSCQTPIACISHSRGCTTYIWYPSGPVCLQRGSFVDASSIRSVKGPNIAEMQQLK